MQHVSIKLDTPIEFVNVQPYNPLIAKCQIKVCWVGETPNRNKSVITKEVATKIANSLPGSPIVGFYDVEKEDFDTHTRELAIEDGKIIIKDKTKPYGFVDLNARVWFQKFLDDGVNEREYLMTEGWLWVGQYPEAKRIIEQGNNQSMELSKNFLDAFWTKNNNGVPQFFIINEAIMEKLCILGEECEPCFEGANITAPTIQFSFDDGFREQLFSMMNELTSLLGKGGTKVFTRYSVEIGDALWTALYSHVSEKYSDYQIESVCEDEGQKYAILHLDEKYFQLNFSMEEENYNFAEELTEVEGYVPSEEPQFDPEAVKNYKIEDKDVQVDNGNSEDIVKGDEGSIEEPAADPTPEPVEEPHVEPQVPTYSLEEIPEYVELTTKYSELENKYNLLQAEYTELEAKLAPLSEFKAEAEKKEKEAMIAKFYMLSDSDKKDVIDNIDTYSLDDIEAKLSIICVRNKVSFLEEDNEKNSNDPTTYDLHGVGGGEENNAPDWVKAALRVAKTM